MKLIESGNENPHISSAKFILSFELAAEQIQIEPHCKEARHVCAFSSSAVFILFVCTCIKWTLGAYIRSSSHDKPAYNYQPNGSARDFRDILAFKMQQNYLPDEENKRDAEDPTVPRPTLRVGNSPPESSSNNLFLAP